MQILEITDPKFRKYGRVIKNVDFSELVEAMQNTPLPDGVDYVASLPELEALPVFEELSVKTYGEMPIQIGYCNGHNVMLNAVEYHRDSEINVAATDAVLVVGMLQDVSDDFHYDTSLMEAFRVPKGVGVEIYGTTLHYAPCGENGAGFKVAIVLPRETNFPLTKDHNPGEDRLLMARNKWLIAHAEGGQDPKAFIGLDGKNLNISE